MRTPEGAAVAVHVVDDDPDVRDSLAFLLRSRGHTVRLWVSGEAFLDGLSAGLRGCVVLDMRMAGLSGLDVLERLAEAGARLPVIVLTGHGDVPIAVRSLKNGAHDFMEKPFDPADLVERIAGALATEARLHAEAEAARAVTERLASLSVREREVMDLMLAGRMNKQIADELGITMRTVEVHRARVLEKFAVRSAVELAQIVTRGR